jgi:hypothetical protein
MRCVGLIQFPNGALSLSPVVVKECQKSNHKFQSLRVGCSRGNLNVDVFSLPLGMKMKSLRYFPSAVVRSNKNMDSNDTRHQPRLCIASGLRFVEKKISIMT